MTDRNLLRETFVTGLESYETRLTNVIRKHQEGDEPPYPFASFAMISDGIAPWEPQNRTPNELVAVASSDPNFDNDIEKKYEKDFFLTISIDIIGTTENDISEIEEQVQNYFLHRFDTDALDNDLNIRTNQVNANGQENEFIGGNNEIRYNIDAQLLTDLTDSVTLRTIETLEFSNTSGLYPGETIN